MADPTQMPMQIRCSACRGDGDHPGDKAALISGVPYTVQAPGRICRLCDGRGWLRVPAVDPWGANRRYTS